MRRLHQTTGCTTLTHLSGLGAICISHLDAICGLSRHSKAARTQLSNSDIQPRMLASCSGAARRVGQCSQPTCTRAHHPIQRRQRQHAGCGANGAWRKTSPQQLSGAGTLGMDVQEVTPQQTTLHGHRLLLIATGPSPVWRRLLMAVCSGQRCV